MSEPGFTCPICGRVSHHPKDAENRFCGVCGFVDDPRLPTIRRRHEWEPSRVGHGEARLMTKVLPDMSIEAKE